MNKASGHGEEGETMVSRVSCSWLVALVVLAFQASGSLAADHVRKNLRFELREGVPLKVRLEVDAGTLNVGPGNGENVSLAVDYNPDWCEFDAKFDEDRNLLRIRMSVKSWFREQKESGKDVARLDLLLPRSVNTELKCRSKASEADLDLGGLQLERLELKVLAGETTLRFDEPNPVRLRRLKIDEKVGELTVEKLGNARFETGEINTTIGDLQIDLSGDEPPDVDQNLELHLGVGAAEISAPADWPVRFEISKGLASVDVDGEFERREGGYESSSYRSAEHTLEVFITERLGSLEIRAR